MASTPGWDTIQLEVLTCSAEFMIACPVFASLQPQNSAQYMPLLKMQRYLPIRGWIASADIYNVLSVYQGRHPVSSRLSKSTQYAWFQYWMASYFKEKNKGVQSKILKWTTYKITLKFTGITPHSTQQQILAEMKSTLVVVWHSYASPAVGQLSLRHLSMWRVTSTQELRVKQWYK